MSRNLCMCNPVRGLYGTIDIYVALVPPEKHGLNLCIWLHRGWVRAANCILHIIREDFEWCNMIVMCSSGHVCRGLA